ncbi:amino acid racemase [Paenibacillus sp. 7124]|uniref:Amino acid racemase n=1 Tax=Paenibacillus apii TaxID=1850370 RepID=A0A6M1PQI9_9BACL|nr:amino acid racemase [Paenibacillus apii]NGM84375.1 amino acid racemase [Paenibacillus apii]NJJ38325.1 amino acid racemase [Paenibacillus apii]
MKKVGIVGGTGPESTVDYYQSIISKFQEKIGSKEELPELFINSINMYKMFNLLMNGQTQELINYLTDAIQKLESVGADFVVFTGNTPHIVFEQVQEKVQVPMISIVEETYLKAQELSLEKIGLIGTKFTMENDFFKQPFVSHNIEMVVPNQSEQEYIHRKIVEELENGIVNNDTKKGFLNIIEQMTDRDGIQAIILGCTELPMLIKNEDLNIHSLNTAEIHINKIMDTIFMDTTR